MSEKTDSVQLIREANNLAGRLMDLLSCTKETDERYDKILTLAKKSVQRFSRRTENHIEKFGKHSLPLIIG